MEIEVKNAKTSWNYLFGIIKGENALGHTLITGWGQKDTFPFMVHYCMITDVMEVRMKLGHNISFYMLDMAKKPIVYCWQFLLFLYEIEHINCKKYICQHFFLGIKWCVLVLRLLKSNWMYSFFWCCNKVECSGHVFHLGSEQFVRFQLFWLEVHCIRIMISYHMLVNKIALCLKCMGLSALNEFLLSSLFKGDLSRNLSITILPCQGQDIVIGLSHLKTLYSSL